MVRLLKWLIGLILVIPTTVLIVLGILAFLLFTNAGLTSSLWVAQKIVPELKVESADGSFLPNFTLNNVSYINPELNIDSRARQLSLATSLDCIVEKSICVDTVSVDGLYFSMPILPSSSEEEASTDDGSGLSTFLIPLPISLTHLSLNDIDLNILGNKIDWQTFSTGFYAFGKTITLKPTEWKNINLTLAPSSTEKSETSKSSDPSFPIQLPEVILPFNSIIQGIDIQDFTLHQASPVIVNRLAFSGNMLGSKVNVKSLTLDMPEADLQLKTDVDLRGDYPLDLQAKSLIKLPSLKGQKVEISADGSVADLSLSSTLSGPIKAKIKAKLQPLESDMPFLISLQDGQLQWPFVGQADYQASIQQLDGKGDLSQYWLNLEGTVSGTEIPESEIVTKAEGNLKQIELNSLAIKTLGGEVAGQAKVHWASPFYWQATLGLTDIQPGFQWPQADGIINGSVVNAGGLTEQGGWTTDLPILNIEGEFQGEPLVLKGKLHASDLSGKGEYKVKIPHLKVAHAGNGLDIKGSLDKNWDMILDVDMPKLSKSVPQLQGAIQGSLQLKGKQNQPDIISDISAKQIVWQPEDASLMDLTLKGHITPFPAPSGNIQLKAHQGRYQDQQLDSLNLTFSGDEKQHTLSLDGVTSLISAAFVITGGLEGQPYANWSGQLQQAQFSFAEKSQRSLDVWRLKAPLEMEYLFKQQALNLQAHCWENSPSSLCLTKDTQVGASGEIDLTLARLSLQQAQSFLPEGSHLVGEVNAEFWAKWAPNLAPQLKAKVDLPAGHFEQELDATIQVPWDKIALTAQMKNNALDMAWLFDLQNNGDIKGDLHLPNVQSQQMKMKGKNSINQVHLGFLSALLGEQNRLEAIIQSDLNLQGEILHPSIKGDVALRSLSLEGQAFPVDIPNGEIELQFLGYQAKLNSILQTTDGQLNLKGNADWSNMKKWLANLRVFGDELKVDIPQMGSVKVQPDLTMSVTPTLAKVTGDINIPWGRILVESLPESAVGLSSDEIILDEEFQPVEPKTGLPMALETNVAINIGDDVSLSAFGLRGNLIGRLNVSQKNKGPFILGEVRIEDGNYQSFGQDLLIQEGKILMNGPADQPYVSIKAIRNPDNTEDDVIAGIQVTGPADAPEVTVFSEPAMAQTSALSYLLRGQDVDDGNSGSTMTTALIGLSLARSGRVVGQIGEAFGVQDLQLGTAGSGDDSQVTVSGYIAPGLQVKYGVGIFNAVGEFTVRYELITDLYVEAVTGLDSAVDFIYQFSFN